jgi:acyl-CoA synthetase (NDP forming)/GNAT superfamily N-acetyltransferase
VKGERVTELTADVRSYALLADGATIEIRPAGRSDFDRVLAFHQEMSPDHLYLRFFSLSKRAAQDEAQRVCRPAGSDHAALLALLNDEVVGLASYEPTGRPAAAEVAFAVADQMHGRGVATLLLEHLVSFARAHGVAFFTAQTLAENSAMLRVFADAGLSVRRQTADGVVELTMLIPRGVALSEASPYLDAVESREHRADVASLVPLLAPRSVAVIGAGRRPGSIGRAILLNIRDAGFAGPLYAVNPHLADIDGIPCAGSVSALPEPPDLAIVAVPAAGVLDAAQECGRCHVKALVVITSGLDAGQQAGLLEASRRWGMRLVGPNCFGVAVPGIGLDATFAARHPAAGTAGLAVQSGGVGIALLEHLSRLGIGISSFASVGDKLDVSGNDMLAWWEKDETTKLAVLYLESFGSPRKFARTARRVGARLPVLTVHAGRSAPGQRAAASHTAAAAAPLITRQALFEQAGIIATTSLGELLDATVLLACQPVPAGGRVCVVSNAGGAGVLAADAAAEAGLTVVTLSPAAQDRLRAILPAGASVSGPVDTTAAVTAEAFRDGLTELARNGESDAMIALVVPTAAADLVPTLTAGRLDVPVAAVILDQPDAVTVLRGGVLRDRDGSPDVPAYAYPEGAARALGRAARYGTWRSRPAGTIPEIEGLRVPEARALIGSFLSRVPGGGWLSPAETLDLLRCYGVPLVETVPVRGTAAAVAAAAALGRPVVIKADVPGLVHKSDAGAVELDLRGARAVRSAMGRLEKRFPGRLSGVIVQPMITGGIELIIGVVQEPVFGPVVVFGLGGVATEVLGDHAARLAPLTSVDADDLIHSLRATPLLLGYRGQPAADLGGLRDTLLRISRLAADLPQVAELDLNPVIARPDGITAVDARIRVSCHAAGDDPFLRQLRTAPAR